MSTTSGGAKTLLPVDFRQLFEASPDVLLVLLPDSPRFTMVGATEARLRATHTSREDTMGRGLFEIFPDNPDDPGATGMTELRASLERVLATRAADTMAVQKYDIRGPDGTFQTKYWSPKNIPVLGADGAIDYILHRVEDVTDLVQASELGQELRDRTQQMEREVVTRSRELAQANQHLREANTRLGELDTAKMAFFSNVSHEFRTPLTLLLGPLENALTRQPPLPTAEEVASMHRNALRLLRLVNSLLDFSRIEGGRLRLRLAKTELGTFTAGLAGSFQSLMDEAGLAFTVDCPELPEAVYVDRSQWEKIVFNLISNAFKFTLSGEIEVRQHWQESHVELSIRDTGTGIPEHELPHIFERFHRVADAQGRSFEGTGIGLALVDDLVKLHGGTVRVESVPGRGSTFTVSIPTGVPNGSAADVLGEPEQVEQRGVSAEQIEARQWLARGGDDAPSLPSPEGRHDAWQSTRAGLPPSRILIVDDNTDMRGYLRSLLAPHYEVVVASNGAEALAAIQGARPDLVLSDVMMPVMDGIELLNELKSNPATNTIPVVLLSARAGEEARLDGIETGADDYLVKPFATRELFARVATHLSVARLHQTAVDTARELAETRAHLIRELEHANRSLHESYNQLAETQAQLVHAAKMASLGELVSGIAHEINNPLAFVKSHLGTVRRILGELEADVAPGSGARRERDSWAKASARLTEVERGLERIAELIVKLRIFSRLDEGERKVASIRECIDSIVTILHHRLGSEIEIVQRLEGPDLVDCYPALLNQALLNLIANAIDAVGSAGAIVVSSALRGETFELRVVDTGPGVPEDLRERVLEPFFTTKPVGKGTGLGLSIAYSIAKKHGGELRVERAPVGGAMFVFAFPWRDPTLT